MEPCFEVVYDADSKAGRYDLEPASAFPSMVYYALWLGTRTPQPPLPQGQAYVYKVTKHFTDGMLQFYDPSLPAGSSPTTTATIKCYDKLDDANALVLEKFRETLEGLDECSVEDSRFNVVGGCLRMETRIYTNNIIGFYVMREVVTKA